MRIAALALLFGTTATLWARYAGGPPFEEAIERADRVAVLVPLENRPAKDRFRSAYAPEGDRDFAAINTRFSIRAVLKGKRPAAGDLTVLHFAPKPTGNGVMVNGPQFARFALGSVALEIRDAKQKGPPGTYTFEPQWLAVLKRRADGRFEPVHGQYDSADSFRLLSHGRLLPEF